jgi:hypothetical protein
MSSSLSLSTSLSTSQSSSLLLEKMQRLRASFADTLSTVRLVQQEQMHASLTRSTLLPTTAAAFHRSTSADAAAPLKGEEEADAGAASVTEAELVDLDAVMRDLTRMHSQLVESATLPVPVAAVMTSMAARGDDDATLR